MRYRNFVLCFLLISPLLIKAQHVKVVRDLKSRTALGFEKEIVKNINVFGEVELCLEQNLEEIGKIYGELGADYAPLKFLSFKAKYRFSKNRKNYSDEFKFTHTFAIATEADYKINRLKFYYRLQYQNIDDEIYLFTGTGKKRNLIRNRIKVKYNIKGIKIDPFISSELYAPWETNGLSVSKLKTFAGIEYDVKKIGELKLYYRNDKELTQYIPYSYHTLGVSFTFKF